MGAASHKTLHDIVKSKYSFVQPKSNLPQQISGWRYTEQDLQNTKQSQGESLKWPYKLYSDEGYLFLLISNTAVADSTKRERRNESKQSPQLLLGELKISVQMIELLYSFYHGEIEEYLQIEAAPEKSNKYNTEQLSLTIFVYTGQNLSSYAKTKLLSQGILLERYVARGGMCAISKLYHQYDQIQDLRQAVKWDSSDSPRNKEQQYFVEIAALVGDKVKAEEDEKLKANIYQKELQNLYQKFNRFTLLKKVLMEPYIRTGLPLNGLLIGQAKTVYPSLDGSLWSGQQLIIKNNSPISQTNTPQTQGHNFLKNKQKQARKQPTDEFQFACEISQINIRDKRAGDQGQPINQSLSMAELQALLDKRVNFVRIHCSQDDHLVFSDYTSIKEYNEMAKYNIGLILNCGPMLCHNYYLNDCQYLWYYLAPLPNKTPADAVLYEYNIENAIFRATQAIITHAANHQKGTNANNRVLIHSAGQTFSNQNCAIAIGYMITRFLYTFEKAFEILNKHFKEFSKSSEAQLTLNKIYTDQLQVLQARVLTISNPSYGIAVNPNNWRVYQLSNNHSDPSQSLITRYVGQIANLNQLQSLPNHSHHLFIALSNQLTPTLSQIIDKWQKDASIKVTQGVTGIKAMLGKEFEFRDSYLPKVKESVCLLLKYEFIDRSKHQKAFSNEFLFKFIDEVVSSNLKAENIEKSFRKPAPFIPLYVGFEQQNPVNPSAKKTNPYNSKQKLTFKYPYLRPTWQSLRDDQCYFMVQVSEAGAYVQISKGKNWIGFEQDKQTYFESIVKTYLYNIDEDKIWITEEGEESIFGDRLELT